MVGIAHTVVMLTTEFHFTGKGYVPTPDNYQFRYTKQQRFRNVEVFVFTEIFFFLLFFFKKKNKSSTVLMFSKGLADLLSLTERQKGKNKNNNTAYK